MLPLPLLAASLLAISPAARCDPGILCGAAVNAEAARIWRRLEAPTDKTLATPSADPGAHGPWTILPCSKTRHRMVC